MRKYGLIGYPLGHSFSKKYFTQKFINESIPDCDYCNYPLTNINQLPILLSEEAELCGLNVTIPYKSEVIKFLDNIDPEAEEIGAVNVIKIIRDTGRIKLYGYNSDVTGIRDSIFPFIKDGVKNALVLGTGGSSRAVCYVLRKSGVNISLISRDKKPGALIYSEISKELIQNAHLIVNTTPLGMYPDIETLPDLDYSLLGQKHILFDLVYNPEKTAFLRAGEERGCKIVSGLNMLHSQAEKAWKIWNED